MSQRAASGRSQAPGLAFATFAPVIEAVAIRLIDTSLSSMYEFVYKRMRTRRRHGEALQKQGVRQGDEMDEPNKDPTEAHSRFRDRKNTHH
jgi:hypothetical protein